MSKRQSSVKAQEKTTKRKESKEIVEELTIKVKNLKVE